MTSLLIYRKQDESIDLDGLSKKALDSLRFIEDRTEQNYKSWKEYLKKVEHKNFMFVEIPHEDDPTCTFLYFVNCQSVRNIYDENREIFTKKTSLSSNEFIKELSKPNINLWRKVFRDHELAGLLYGYGVENIESFHKVEKTFSEKPYGEVSQKHFPIPIFSISKKDKTSEKYKRQRKEIKSYYQKEGLLKGTLKLLQKG